MDLRTFSSTSLSVLLLSMNGLQAQTKKAATGPYQLQKGHWMISHNMVSIAPYSSEYTNYDQNNKVTSSYKSNGTGFSLAFTAPNWGNAGAGGGKTKYYNAANKPTETDKESNFNVYLNPSAGYFIQDRLLLGAQLLINYYSGNSESSEPQTNYSSDRNYKQFSAGIGPEIRYYFGNAASRQLFHAGISSLFSTGKSTDDYNTSHNNQKNTSNREDKSTYYSITFYAGSSWKLGKRWLLESALFSTVNSYKTESEVLNISNNVSTNSRGSSKSKSNSIIGVRAGLSYTF
jgi:hypothetical protein